jgi:hypothetical protein
MKRPNYPKKLGSAIWWAFLSPWEAAMSAPLLAFLAILAGTYFGGSTSSAPSTASASHWPFLRWLELSAFLYLCSTLISIWKDSYRRRFDPTLALKYLDIFFKDNEDKKEEANKRLISYLDGTDVKFETMEVVDDVLDLLDDIGFLVQGNQISHWVAYQYFSYWVQLYYEAARDYINHVQEREESPSIWEHVPDLYCDLMEIEVHKVRSDRKKRAKILDAKARKYARRKIAIKDLELDKDELIRLLRMELRNSGST